MVRENYFERRSMAEIETLAVGLPKQQERVRGVLKTYEDIGKPGLFGAMMIRESLKKAEIAASSGDVVDMIRAYQDLKEIK